MPDREAPERFEFVEGDSLSGASRRLSWDRERIWFESWPGELICLDVPHERWESFWREADKIELWD